MTIFAEPAGDSTTDGVGSTDNDGFPGFMYDWFFPQTGMPAFCHTGDVIGLTRKNIRHHGFSGQRAGVFAAAGTILADGSSSSGARDINLRLASTLLRRPKIYQLWIGTNGAANSNTQTDQELTDIDTVMRQALATHPNCVYIVGNLMNSTDANAAFKTRFNNGIGAIWSGLISSGMRLVRAGIDAGSSPNSVINTGTDLSDGLHPNDTGYSKLAAQCWEPCWLYASTQYSLI